MRRPMLFPGFDHFTASPRSSRLLVLCLVASTGAGIEECTSDADGDGYDSSQDCDDSNAAVYPGAFEGCDGLDNDCNGIVDDGCGGDGITQLEGGYGHSLALDAQGKVWSWGWGEDGQLGDGTFTSHCTPKQIPNVGSMVLVYAGYAHSLALDSSGQLWSWGWNQSGQLGDGTNTDRSSPVRVVNLPLAKTMHTSTGHSLAVDPQGQVWAWGWGYEGQLGDGGSSNKNVPTLVAGIPPAVAVATGTEHSIALAEDGHVWGWGSNLSGQLGDGTTTGMRHLPRKIEGLENIRQVQGLAQATLALDDQGRLWGWGETAYPCVLSSAAPSGSTVPVELTGLTNIAAFWTGLYHTLLLRTDGTLLSWGINGDGQLGSSASSGPVCDPSPVRLPSSTAFAGTGYYFSGAVDRAGKLYAWGDNSKCQLGDGTTTPQFFPIAISFE